MKLNYKRTFFIGLAFMSISAFWQLYDGIVPLILDNTFGLGETLTGGIMALDNILALFLLPLFGAFSDRVDTRFGKRMPFILIGTVCAVIFMTILPYADQTRNFPLFFVSLGLLLLAMGVYRSPAVALMPDLTPKPLRSQANAVINLMGAAGGILTLGFISLLISEEANPDYTMVFAAVSALMVAAVGVLVLTIREKRLAEELAKQEPIFTGQGSTVEQGPTAADQGPTLSEQQPIDMGDMGTVEPSDGIRESGHRDNNHGTDHQGTGSGGSLPREVRRSLFFLLASIFLWFTAYNAVTTAFSRYAGRVWGLQGGGFANALMVATGAAIVSYIPIGFVSGSIGRKKTILIGILIMTASYFTGFLFTEYSPWINIVFAFTGIGWSAINVNSYPMVVEMSRSGDVGRYTGYYYTFSMAAQIITPILSGFLLETISYRTLFPYAMVFSLLSFCTMLMVRHGDSKPPKKGSKLEQFS